MFLTNEPSQRKKRKLICCGGLYYLRICRTFHSKLLSGWQCDGWDTVDIPVEIGGSGDGICYP